MGGETPGGLGWEAELVSGLWRRRGGAQGEDAAELIHYGTALAQSSKTVFELAGSLPRPRSAYPFPPTTHSPHTPLPPSRSAGSYYTR